VEELKVDKRNEAPLLLHVEKEVEDEVEIQQDLTLIPSPKEREAAHSPGFSTTPIIADTV